MLSSMHSSDNCQSLFFLVWKYLGSALDWHYAKYKTAHPFWKSRWYIECWLADIVNMTISSCIKYLTLNS